MLNSRFVFVLLASVFLISCGRGAVIATPTLPATRAPAPTVAAPIAPSVPPTSAAPASANVPGSFSKTDPQLAPADIKGDVARGTQLFNMCNGCHDVTKNYPGGEVAPNLANISTIAVSIIKSTEYKGKAKTVAEYFRESILSPNTFIVPGDDYHTKDGNSAMRQDFALTLTPQQVEDLVAYVLSLKPE